ncbi:MAG: hypothetical protein AB1757_21245 [Acidobacteriota bacterium]
MNERVTITDALAYIKEKSGHDFERRTFTRWLEQGSVSIDGIDIKINAKLIEGKWKIGRDSLENLIKELNA